MCGTFAVPDVTQTPEIRPQFTRQISTESNDSFSSARSSYEQGDYNSVIKLKCV